MKIKSAWLLIIVIVLLYSCKFISDMGDDEAPVISIDYPVNEKKYRPGSLAIQGKASDNGKVAKIEVSINNGAYSLATGTTEWVYVFDASLLAEGAHSIIAKSTDNSGNTNTTEAVFNIDKTTPIADLSGAPQNRTNAANINITVGGNSITAYRYSLDGADWTGEFSAGIPITASGLLDGLHNLKVIGKNSVGNWQEGFAPTVFEWTIDTVQPVAALSALTNPSSSRSINATVSGSDVVSYMYNLDGTGWSGEIITGTAITASGLSDGQHTLQVVGKDSAGNWQNTGNPTSQAWTVDIVYDLPICITSDSKFNSKIIQTSTGTIIIWANGSYDLYGQKIDDSGNILWGANGKLLCSGALASHYPPEIVETSDGIVMVWDATKSKICRIYAQKIDNNGNFQWEAGGKQICSTRYQSTPKIVNTSSGFIVLWKDSRNIDLGGSSNSSDIYGQKIDNSGNLLWGASGKAISNTALVEGNPAIFNTSLGIIITWYTGTNNIRNIIAQKIDENGNFLWTSNKIIASNSNAMSIPEILDISSGLIFTWFTLGSSDSNIYAQKIDNSNNVLWGSGKPICTDPGNQTTPQIVETNTGIIIAWTDGDIYSRKIDENGNFLWPSSKPICTASASQSSIQVVNTDSGTVFVWSDGRNGIGNSHIYAQKMDSDDNFLWTENGKSIRTGKLFAPKAISSTYGAIIIWFDTNSNYDIYVRKINSLGD